MKERFRRISKGELRKYARETNRSAAPNLMPANFWHIYIKLDFKQQYENAATKSDGKSFVRNVMRASSAVEEVLSESDGVVIEVQGSVIHCLLSDDEHDTTAIRQQCRLINYALHLVFNDASRVEGWRMATDWGKTLLVSGRGIHNDNSYVSLGNSANAPAKYLFAQLARSSEENRALKRYMLAWRESPAHEWQNENLGAAATDDFQKMASSRFTEIRARHFDVTSVLSKEARAAGEVKAQAAPVGSPGSASGVNQGDPIVYFGWVMRADLDGFTSRVEECFDNDMALLYLGEQFQDLMDEAAKFADEHSQTLVQLPWAGDNFTAAVVFSQKSKYEAALEEKLVHFSIDFSAALAEPAAAIGLKGWAQSVAGTTPHGNSEGNIYIGAVEFKGRRFLIGTGQGFGRSTQGFSDINPGPEEIVIFEEDFQYLLKPYQNQLQSRQKGDGGQSTLFRRGKIADLAKARKEIDSRLSAIREPVKTTITVGGTAMAASGRAYGQASDILH